MTERIFIDVLQSDVFQSIISPIMTVLKYDFQRLHQYFNLLLVQL